MGMVAPFARYSWQSDPNQTSVDVPLVGVKVVSSGPVHFATDADGTLWQYHAPEHSLDGTGWVYVNASNEVADRIAAYLHDTFGVVNLVEGLNQTTWPAPEPTPVAVDPASFSEPVTSG